MIKRDNIHIQELVPEGAGIVTSQSSMLVKADLYLECSATISAVELFHTPEGAIESRKEATKEIFETANLERAVWGTLQRTSESSFRVTASRRLHSNLGGS